MKGKLAGAFLIIVFLVVIALICAILSDNGRDELPIDNSAPQSPVFSTAEPVVPITTAVPTAVPTPVPTPTPSPTPVPTPTPIPTPSPTPAPVQLGNGSFASETGAKLNIRADWSSSVNGDNVDVTVTVYALSYSLHLSPAHSVYLNLGDQYVTLDAPEVTYDGNTETQTQLASHVFTVPLAAGTSTTQNLAVEWHFGGTYGKDADGNPISLPVLECGGKIQLSR